MATSYTNRLGTSPEEGTKSPVAVETAANITLSGEQTVNSVAVTAGDRVLVKDQTDGTEDGIYVVATGAWSRSTDFNEAEDVISGVLVPVATGKIYQGTWTGDYTVDTTEPTFTLITDTGLQISGVTASADEINVLDGISVTLETADLDILDGLLATTAELNTLDGITSTVTELNVLSGIAATLTAAELSILDGVTATAAEINVVDGVTAGTVAASKALIVDANKDLATLRNVTATKFDDGTANLTGGVLTGVTLADGALATTQTEHDNSTKVATTAYVDGKKVQIETVTAANTITAAENGKTFILSLAGGFESTLPTPAAGLHFKFIVGVAPTTAYTIVTESSSNIIHGQVCTPEDAAGSVSTVASADTITFVALKAIVGDYVEVVSDGTSWFLSGMCNVQDGVTTTQATP